MINLSKITPAAAVRLLNSTPLGQVMGERQVSRHLQRAGYRIAGDPEGKTVNLLKYAAWLVDENVEKQHRQSHDSTRSYDDVKEAARQRAAEMSQSGRDIGEIPAVVDTTRKEACRFNLRLYLETYFPQKFGLAWSDDHLLIVDKIETAVLKGGLFALAMPRGTGKTTICERAALWATSYGHRRFVALVGATEDAARQILAEIKMEIECNDLLNQDFPEISFPVRRLDGITNRANGQTCRGVRTRITWADDELVFPTVAGSAATGVVIQVRGITGRIRGMKAAVATGESLRPDLVLIDDPQTDESAASPEQNRKRLRILSGAILGLAGPGVKISGVMPCTVIRPGDMADEILNRDRHPEWNGERRKMLIEFPVNMELWNRYHEVWADSFRCNGNISEATEFYLAHRAAMDAGAVVSWPARYEVDEASGIQHAMNKYIANKDTFYSEYQNEPLPDDLGEAEKITVDQVWSKMNKRKRGEIPAAAEHLVMFIDVQKNLLYYTVCAFGDNFSCWTVDYGAFPDQRRRYFSLREANPTYQSRYAGHGLEAAIYAAVNELTEDYLTRDWLREDGAPMRIGRCLVDSGWGKSTEAVYQVCRESLHAAVLIPSKGMGITAAARPITEYRKNQGDKIGFNWMIPKARGKKISRYVLYDTNFWKSFFRERIMTPMGDPGCFSVWGSDEEGHRLFAEHLSSEISEATAGRGRRVDIWKLLPGRENHWLDGVVGCHVGASMLGCSLIPGGNPAGSRNATPENRGGAPKRITPGVRITPRRS